MWQVVDNFVPPIYFLNYHLHSNHFTTYKHWKIYLVQIRIFSKGKRNIIVVLGFHVEFQGRGWLEALSTNPTWRLTRTCISTLVWMGQSDVLVNLEWFVRRRNLAKVSTFFWSKLPQAWCWGHPCNQDRGMLCLCACKVTFQHLTFGILHITTVPISPALDILFVFCFVCLFLLLCKYRQSHLR